MRRNKITARDSEGVDPSTLGPLAKPNVAVIEREGRDPVIVDMDYPAWAQVNETGLEILSLMDGKRDVDGISREMARRYGIPLKKALQDAEEFLKNLTAAGFFKGTGSAVSRDVPPVNGLFIHLTEACNLACRHCYLSSGPDKARHLDTRLVLRLLDELAERGRNQVVISGGEPLVHPDFFAILAHVKDRLQVRLLTNGMLLDDRTAGMLSDMDCRVQISLDGSMPGVHDSIRGQGSFEAALHAVDLIKRHGLKDRLNLCAVITRDNYDDLPWIVKLAARLEAPFVRFLPMRLRGTAATEYDGEGMVVTSEEYDRWYERVVHEISKNAPGLRISSGLSGLVFDLSDYEDPLLWCPAGRSLNLDAAGNMYPCALFMEQEYHIGEAASLGLAGADKSSVRQEMVCKIRERRDRIDECRSCTWRQFCQSGCPGIANMQHGSVMHRDDHCDLRKRLYEDLVFDLVEAREPLSMDPGYDDY